MNTSQMSKMKVYAVIAGYSYEGEDFNSLKLFDCLSSAKAYAKELEGKISVDYTLIEEREIIMESAIVSA